jgi:protein SCO1/2
MGLLRRCSSGRAVPFGCVLAALLLGAAIVGCDRAEGGPGLYAARGIVEDVDVANAQVLIDHEDVPGLMPAMTMSFAVPDAEVLAGLARGQVIAFGLRFTGRSYEVESFEVVGAASPEQGWRRLGDALVRTSPAPDFDLIDQSGEPVRSGTLQNRVWVVDFIYTDCPGPCPIQTARRVALQRRVPESFANRVQFLSFSLDPEVDRPAKLREYAEARGADLSNWSFLTGDREVLADLVRRWGVGSVRKQDGSIDHTLISFLVKEGRIYDHYSMQPESEEQLFQDLLTLLREDSG